MASLWKVRWLLFFTLFALPITFFPWAYLAFELPKISLLYLLSILAAYILFVSGYGFKNLTKSYWLYLIFLGWIIFTAMLGLSPMQSFLGSYFRMQSILSWVCYSLLFFISADVFEDRHFRKYAGIAILTASTATAVLAIIQFVLLWFFGNITQLLYSNRVISTFGQPNFLGAYLVMSLPFAWFLFKQIRGKRKALTSILIVVIILGIFSTLSRSAYLGLAVLALLWGFYHYRLLLTGIILSIILFAILANLFPNLVYREWYRFQVDTVAKWTAENRLEIAQKSIQLIAQKPIIGYGIENFSLAFPSVISPNDLGLKDLVVDSSHNLFLDLAVQTGITGLVLFLTIIALSFASGFKQLRQVETENRGFIKTAMCAVVTFLIIHQFSVVSVAPMVLFWISMGIVNSPSVIAMNTVTKQSSVYVIRFIGLSLIILTVFFIIQTFRAEYFFRQASAYEVSDIYKAIKLDNNAIKLAPWIEFYQIRRNFLLKQLG